MPRKHRIVSSRLTLTALSTAPLVHSYMSVRFDFSSFVRFYPLLFYLLSTSVSAFKISCMHGEPDSPLFRAT